MSPADKERLVDVCLRCTQIAALVDAVSVGITRESPFDTSEALAGVAWMVREIGCAVDVLIEA